MCLGLPFGTRVEDGAQGQSQGECNAKRSGLCPPPGVPTGLPAYKPLPRGVLKTTGCTRLGSDLRPFSTLEAGQQARHQAGADLPGEKRKSQWIPTCVFVFGPNVLKGLEMGVLGSAA